MSPKKKPPQFLPGWVIAQGKGLRFNRVFGILIYIGNILLHKEQNRCFQLLQSESRSNVLQLIL